MLISVAQNSYINNRWTLQGSYAKREYSETYISSDTTVKPIINNINEKIYTTQILYGYATYFETGLNFGIATSIKQFSISNNNYLTFELKQKFQLLPLLSKNKSRFDLYIPISIIENYYLNPTLKKLEFSQWCYGIGSVIYLYKQLGLVFELTIKQHKYYTYNPYLQFGLSYIWHTKQKITPEQ